MRSAHLEYKPTFRTRAGSGELFKPLQTASLKTVAAFLNSREGGTLLIGVADGGSVLRPRLRLRHAPQTRKRRPRPVRPPPQPGPHQLRRHGGRGKRRTGELEVVGKDLCRVHGKPSSFPVEARVVEVDKNDQHVKKTVFYVRSGNGTRAVTDPRELERHKTQVWGR